MLSLGQQSTNSIVINASGISHTGASASATYIAPLRNIIQPQVLGYNTATAEISYWTKTFVINHPINKDKYLVHGCLEGPEAGVYYRGRDETYENICVIKLPEYVRYLAREFTVQVTSIFEDKFVQLSCSEVKDNKFTVYSSDYTKFYWHVYGKRQSIDIEPNKNDVVVHGTGPYKWIQM